MADYTIQQILNLIILIDRNEGGRSLTNDVEYVVADLVERGHVVDGCVIVYRDSMGRWDQIVTEDSRFKRFHPLVNNA